MPLPEMLKVNLIFPFTYVKGAILPGVLSFLDGDKKSAYIPFHFMSFEIPDVMGFRGCLRFLIGFLGYSF